MARGKKDMAIAKAGYADAKNRGDREEQARWANQIGHLLKATGEYVEALRWFRIDYDISLKFMPKKQLMPTCQCMGEMYLRLRKFDDALIYQKKHLQYAKEVDDLVEQQRASTQLFRTFFDIHENDEDSHYALERAKKYLNMSMELARILKENPPSRNYSSFVKELVDAHNNMGMLKFSMEDYIEAERVLLEGLRICDEEEVGDNDDGRTRLHHNLGRVYIALREWEKAKEHANIDIAICQNIPHPEGEAKGLINLGLIHFKLQKYDDALSCYGRAHTIASTLEDEDALVEDAQLNIDATKEAQTIMSNLLHEEQQLKKLARDANIARGTASERRHQIRLHKCMKQLVELATSIDAWTKCLEYAKKSKNVAQGLKDMEKLSDAFLDIGEAYYNLRNFDKAKKWYMKSWKASKAIHNLEGQAVAKINIGNTLDSTGDWTGALEAYQEGYEMAVQGKVTHSQITALQNMHYSYILRFDNVEHARKLEPDIEMLKKIEDKKGDKKDPGDERCSESESESGNSINLSDEKMTEYFLSDLPSQSTVDRNHLVEQDINMSGQEVSNPVNEDDLPLASYLHSRKDCQKRKAPEEMHRKNKCQIQRNRKVNNDCQVGNNGLPKVIISEQMVGCKRSRIVLSDDESNDDEESSVNPRMEQVSLNEPLLIDKSRQGSKDKNSQTTILNLPDKMPTLCSERITSKAKETNIPFYDLGQTSIDSSSGNNKILSAVLTSDQNGVEFSTLPVQIRNLDNVISVRIGETVVTVDVRGSLEKDLKTIDWLKVEVVQLYCLQLYSNKKSLGMKPVVKELVYNGNLLKSAELVADLIDSLGPGDMIDAVLNGWVRITLAERYLIFCKECNQAPNQKLLNKLYNLTVSEDEVVASDCELHDVSVLPLVKALRENETFSLVDLSHNSLGNQTVHNIQEIIAASDERDLGLTLDLHDNQLGASALRQICQCSVSLSRLEVLNLSGNRLTDACARHISAIIEGSKALAILNLEGCALTSRTIERITSALPSESGLVKLSIGKNPISGNSLSSLLKKLSILKSFSDLDLTNVELKKTSIESICDLLQSSSSISALGIGGNNIGTDGALKISEAFAKARTVAVLDMSFCGVDLHWGPILSRDFISHEGLLQLNLSGNPLEERGVHALESLLRSTHSHLKVLRVNKCCLGRNGVLKIIKSLSENRSLVEVGLAGNNDLEYDIMFNLIDGADRTSMACCGEKVVATMNYCGECSESRSRDESIQNDIPISPESTSFKDCINSNRCINDTTACAVDKTESTKEPGTQKTYKKHGGNCDEYDVADSEDEGKPEHANRSSLEDDRASSSQSLGLIRGRSNLFPDVKSNKYASLERDGSVHKMSEDYASEIFLAICKAKNLRLLDLSDNLLPLEMIEQLYVAWSSNIRAREPVKHIENQIVHFSVEGTQCCGTRLCCQRLN